MHHSLKIKIQDLDHIESIVEQDITAVEAEKIVGGSVTAVNAEIVKIVCSPDDLYCLMNVPPMPDLGNPTWIPGDDLKISASKLLSTSLVNVLIKPLVQKQILTNQ